MPKKLAFGQHAQQKMVAGARTLARAVGCTLGPSGKVVLIDDRFGRPIATKDGVTVARAVHLADPHEHMGANLLADAALKVAEEAGDGTTTCVVVAAKLLAKSFEAVIAGAVPPQFAADLGKAFQVAEEEILTRSLPVTQLGANWIEAVAGVSGNHDKRVVDAVAGAFQHVGMDGSILIREGDSDRIVLDLQSGFRIDKGWVQPALAPETGTEITVGQSLVCVSHRPIHHGHDVLPLIQYAADRGAGLVLVCENLTGTALETVIGNHRSGAVRIVYAKPPGFDARLWDYLHDIATATGATVNDLETGELRPEWMGACQAVKQTRHMTVLVDPYGDLSAVQARVAALEDVRRKSSNAYDRDKAVDRLGRLRGRVAEIQVGAPTPVEAREIKDRIEDACHAVRSACREGVQPGGGTALARASLEVARLATPAAMALAEAMRQPARKILRNGGVDPSLAWQAITSSGIWCRGADATGACCDMLAHPDPTVVVLAALRAAVSTVQTVLMAETAILIEE